MSGFCHKISSKQQVCPTCVCPIQHALQLIFAQPSAKHRPSLPIVSTCCPLCAVLRYSAVVKHAACHACQCLRLTTSFLCPRSRMLTPCLPLAPATCLPCASTHAHQAQQSLSPSEQTPLGTSQVHLSASPTVNLLLCLMVVAMQQFFGGDDRGTFWTTAMYMSLQ